MEAEPRRRTPDADTEDLVGELQASLERAGELIRALQKRVLPRPQGLDQDPAARRVAELQSRLETAENDLNEISSKLVDAEHQRGRLMNLYVATYQLHATMDLDEVKATIAEIARDLLGAERFVLLLRQEADGRCEVAMSAGMDDAGDSPFAGGVYGGGDEMVDRTLHDGVLRIGPVEGSSALAVVPLTVQGVTVGVIVLLKLFDHKPSLTADDRDLLDLLAAHAASAIFAARVYSTTDRKLRTLESLIQLVRGG